jgi:hypothetical protein
MMNIKESLYTTWFYTGDLGDRPAAAKVEVVPVGIWEFGWEASFYRPGDADPFRIKLYLDPSHAYAVAKRYVRFATCKRAPITIESDDFLACVDYGAQREALEAYYRARIESMKEGPR